MQKEILTLDIKGQAFLLELENNSTTAALKKLLPLTLVMDDLNDNEKYYYLDTSLPSAPKRVKRINAGDVMLFGDDCLVIFYKSFDTTYSYTKIGHINDTSALLEAVGSGSLEITIE